MESCESIMRLSVLILFSVLTFSNGKERATLRGLRKEEIAPANKNTKDIIRDKADNNNIASLVCASFPCLNGGTCIVTGTDTYKCKCAPYYTGMHCMTEPLTNVALSTCGAICEASSTRYPEEDCSMSIDGTSPLIFPTWVSDYERVGAWFRINFTDYFRIHTFSMFDAAEDAYQSSLLNLETGDYKIHQADLMCLGTVGVKDKFWQMFDLIPTITNFLHIEVAEVCDPEGTGVLRFRGILVHGNDVPLMNAASLYVGATCTASSEYHQDDFGCHNAIDEVEKPGPGNEWLSDGQGAGAWIQVNLNRSSTVMAVGFLQRCGQTSQNNFLMLDFSDGSSQEIILECFTTGLDPLDCEGQYWQQFDLDPYVVTSYVRVTITAVCTTENNGFREIRVFSLREEGNY